MREGRVNVDMHAVNEPNGNLRPDVKHVAQKVLAQYYHLGGMAFAYGQGSVFTGFSEDADLDINLVWDRPCPPLPEERPITLLCDASHEPVQFDNASLALDKLWVDSRQVDVLHQSQEMFDQKLEQVRGGDGWQEATWPLTLFAVAGFFYGILLDDPHGAGTHAHAALEQFPEALVRKTHEALADNFSFYQDELTACVQREDGWLFHDLLGKLLRDTYITWFAAEQRYCPHLKRIHCWIERFHLNTQIAEVEQRIWRGPNLQAKLELATTMIEQVLQMKMVSEH